MFTVTCIQVLPTSFAHLDTEKPGLWYPEIARALWTQGFLNVVDPLLRCLTFWTMQYIQSLACSLCSNCQEA